ncbi:MAG: EAL domain-containing protein [Deltaproteobacteria bacterium]|nr:EAL domain-containing protein [Deltaproteobacteria bacterium]
MRSRSHTTSIRTLVWILILTSVVAVCAVIGGGYIIVADISQQKDTINIELEQNNHSVRQLETAIAQIRSETLQLFYEEPEINNLGTIIDLYPTILLPLVERLDDQDTQIKFQQYLNELKRLASETDVWFQRHKIIKKEHLHGKQRATVRDLLQRLRSFTNIHLGQQRLEEAIEIRNWRTASKPVREVISTKIINKRREPWFLLFNEIRTEVANLSQQTEILISALQVSRLADVRDNLLKPSIEHLERNLLILDDVRDISAEPALQILEDLKIALFGKDYQIDQQYQTIVARGGLYQLSFDRLQLHQQQAQHEKALQTNYVELENINAHLSQLTQKQYDLLSNRTQQQLQQGLNKAIFGGGIVLLFVFGLGIAISRRVNQQVHQLAVLQRHNELILHAAGDGIVGIDARGYTTFVNPAANALLGFKPEELMGRCFTTLMPVLRESGDVLPHDDHPVKQSLLLTAGQTCRSNNEYFQRRDGSLFSAQYITTPLIGEHNQNEGAVLVFKDISEQQQDKRQLLKKKQQLDYLANHDVLTELPNRRLFRKKLHLAIERCSRTSGEIAVLFIDLDRFKRINDSLGHEVGDMLLKAVAQRLQKCVSHSSTLARLGGDEFVVLIEESSVAENVAEKCRRLLKALSSLFEVDEHRLFVSASIGVSRFPHDAKDETGLMSNADVAMYYAKNHGKNNFQFYTPDMNARAREFQELEIKLRDGLDRQQFILHYQPQLDINTHCLIGVEVLIRWLHPQLGLVPPADFIPLAEESGLIVPIGEWVLLNACKQNQRWIEQGLTPIRVAVNISAIQFQSDLQSTIAKVLQQTGMDANLLELEITESMLMDEHNKIIDVMHSLKKQGIHFSIDDFGTGFSSLSYLKRMPVDKLKIDRSFIKDVINNDNDAAIATSVISLGLNMHLEVIAEGVEQLEQELFLREHGCHSVQGYLHAKPMPADEFVKWRQQH